MFIHPASDEYNQEEDFKEVPVWQGVFFKKWQKRYGRKVVALVAENKEGKVEAYIQCIEYKTPLLGSVWVGLQGPLGGLLLICGRRGILPRTEKTLSQGSAQYHPHTHTKKAAITPHLPGGSRKNTRQFYAAAIRKSGRHSKKTRYHCRRFFKKHKKDCAQV